MNPWISFSCGDFLFVHAGIRPGVPLRKQREEDLLWIREEFLSCEQQFEKFVVHGHTPVRTPDMRSNRINIDTGAFATGRLTCIVNEGTSIVPLIDARNWFRSPVGIQVAQNTPTRIEPAALWGPFHQPADLDPTIPHHETASRARHGLSAQQAEIRC